MTKAPVAELGDLLRTLRLRKARALGLEELSIPDLQEATGIPWRSLYRYHRGFRGSPERLGQLLAYYEATDEERLRAYDLLSGRSADAQRTQVSA